MQAIQPRLTNAVLVSDISLQWLEMIVGGGRTEFLGLSSNLYGRAVSEKHLSWLYQKKSKGWTGPVPPTLILPSGALDPAQTRRLADEDKQGRPVYLLVAMPQSNQWFAMLRREFAEIDRSFSHEPIERQHEVALYRLKPL